MDSTLSTSAISSFTQAKLGKLAWVSFCKLGGYCMPPSSKLGSDHTLGGGFQARTAGGDSGKPGGSAMFSLQLTRSALRSGSISDAGHSGPPKPANIFRSRSKLSF